MEVGDIDSRMIKFLKEGWSNAGMWPSPESVVTTTMSGDSPKMGGGLVNTAITFGT